MQKKKTFFVEFSTFILMSSSEQLAIGERQRIIKGKESIESLRMVKLSMIND